MKAVTPVTGSTWGSELAEARDLGVAGQLLDLPLVSSESLDRWCRVAGHYLQLLPGRSQVA